jgi:iron complex outermembrane receptor protein
MTRCNITRSYVLASLAFLTILFNTTLTGQENTNDEEPAPQAVDDSRELTELTVEAVPQWDTYGLDGRYQVDSTTFGMGGTEETLKETPFSVSSFDRDFLSDVNPAQLDYTATYAPGVQMGNQNSNFSQVFQSRGFQLGRDSILINGMQQADAFSITPMQLVGGIEYYKGPSAILNGQTPPGGAANIITKKPLDQDFNRLSTNFNSHGKQQIALDLNRSDLDLLGVPASFRFNFMTEDSDTFRNEVERETALVAPVATLNLSPDTTLTLEANIIDWEVTDDRGLPLLNGQPATDEEAADQFDQDEFLLGTTDKQNDRNEQRFMLDFSHDWNDVYTTNFQVSYGNTDRSFHQVGPAAFNSGTNQLTRFHFGDLDEQESLDTRLDTTVDAQTGIFKHSGIVAVQYRTFDRTDLAGVFNSSADTIDINDPDPGKPFSDMGAGSGPVTEQDSREVFVQDQIKVTSGVFEGLQTVLGTRFIDYDDELNSDRDEEEFTSRIGVGYTPPSLDEITVYGNYSESFNPQGQTTPSGNTLPPQEGDQVEFGTKAELLDGDLLLTGAYFDITNENAGVTAPSDPFSEIPVGEQENSGFEFEAVGQLLEQLQIRSQMTVNDAEVTESTSASSISEGNALPLTPDTTASTWLRYDVPVFASPVSDDEEDRIVLAGGLTYVDDRFVSAENTIQLTDYVRGDIRARYLFNEQGHLEFGIKNITDEEFFTGGNTFGLGSVTPGQPLTFELGLSYNF